jgi:hypothetical protein
VSQFYSWIRSNLLPLVALAAAGIFFGLWWHARLEAARARQGQERAEMEAQGVAVAHEATEASLRGELDSMATRSADLEEALRKALAAAHGAHVVTVVSGSTGPVSAGTPTGASAPSPSAPAPAPNACACLLKPGDRGQIDVQAAELRTEAGNRILVEAAEASRVDPDGSKVRLFGGELRSDLTKYLSSEVKPEQRPGWGVGAVASVGGGVASVGPALAFPPLRFLGLSIEASAGLTVVGDVRLYGAVVVRP